MDDIDLEIDSISYLKKLNDLFINSENLSEINFILGNNTCDLDSAISSYLLSIAFNIKENAIILDDKNNAKLNINSHKIYLPVLNIKRNTIKYRIEVKYVFDKFNIDENLFWYISDEFLRKDSLFQYQNIKSCNNIINSNIILVDHNLLIEEQNYLSNYVINIYDHHLITKYDNNYPNLQSMNIKIPVGSCSTIVLSDFYMDKFPLKLISPIFALTANLIDSRNFAKDYYGNRWVDLDKKVFDKIKSEIKDNNFNMDKYYKEISGIKHNVEKNLELGVKALLTKVQKYYNFNGFKIIWSAFYISFYDIQKNIGDDEIIDNILEYYKNINVEDVKKIFFVTNSPVDKDKELITIFNPVEIPTEFEEFQNEVEKKNKNYFYSMKKIVYKSNEKIKGIMYYYVVNHFYTRKQIEPILQKICFKLKNK